MTAERNRCLGAVVVVSYLVAHIGALAIVLPDDYRYAPASKEQSQAVLNALMRRKFLGLRVAVWCFGIGTAAFAGLFLIVLFDP